MSVLTVSLLFLLALSHVDVSQSIHIKPTADTGKVPKSSRIYNAQGTATPGQFPFQAYIVVDSTFLYGGALISSHYVLTSANAVMGHYEWNVTLGMTQIDGVEPYRVQQICSLATWYTVVDRSHSVGLIQLPDPVGSEYIMPALLPSLTDASQILDDTEVTFTGFGYEADGGPLSSTLKYTVMKIISFEECQASYGSGLISYLDICALGNGNPCSGDNGGPLFIDEGSFRFKILGVNTFGSASCVTGQPAGFMRIASTSILPWISSITGLEIQP